MSWSDKLKSMLDSFKPGANDNNSPDITAQNANISDTPLNPDDFIDTSWSGAVAKQ